jgi:hypothetical protein
MQNAANEYKTVFTDASKQVESEYVQTTSLFKESAQQEEIESAVEPQFIPYEAAPSTFEELSLEPKIIEYEIEKDK